MYTMICVTGCIDEYISVEELFFWLVTLDIFDIWNVYGLYDYDCIYGTPRPQLEFQ